MVFNFYIHTTVEELGINTFFGLLKENAEAKWLTNNKTKQPPPTPPQLVWMCTRITQAPVLVKMN